MSGIVLDSGALIAIQRNDRMIWAVLKAAALKGTDVLVPSAAVAQLWRGSREQAQLAKALHYCAVASFDVLAREIGELCGKTRTLDVCDAQVAIVAASQGDTLYTSAPSDMRRLIEAYGRRRPLIVRC